jgi:cytochrome P450
MGTIVPQLRCIHGLLTFKSATIAYNGQTYPIDNHLGIIPNGHTLHYDPVHYDNPAKFQPERFLDPENSIPRSNFQTFGRGPRACLGQNLAQDELRIILLMTVRDYEFECADLKPNAKPKASYTALDTVFGDIVFQELGLEARPRGGMMMRCRKV